MLPSVVPFCLLSDKSTSGRVDTNTSKKSVTMASEKGLEKKIHTLEHRLKLVERFVEMRFCESFRDFSMRNLTAVKELEKHETIKKSNKLSNGSVAHEQLCGISDEDNDNDRDVSLVEEDQGSTITYRTRSGRKTTRLSTAALGGGDVAKRAIKPTVLPPREELSISNKVLRVSVARLEVPQDVVSEPGLEVDMSIVKVWSDARDDHHGDERVCSKEDDYFTYPVGEIGSQASQAVEDNAEVEDLDDCRDDDDVEVDNEVDVDWTVSDDNEYQTNSNTTVSAKRKKRDKKPVDEATRNKKRKYYIPSSYKLIAEGTNLQPLNPNTKECPFCHEHWKVELFDRHVQSHMTERHLKCSYCEKRFFQRTTLAKHERSHQIEKYCKKCRLCNKTFSESYKVLAHERFCIRKRLESRQSVDPKIMENVRQRSTNIDLKWPDQNEVIPEGMKKCTHCRVLLKEDLMSAHLKKKHANWKCTYCDKTYVEKCGLVRHLCTSHGENAQTCKLCKRVFETRAAIRAHNAQCRRKLGNLQGTVPDTLPKSTLETNELVDGGSETFLEGSESVVHVEGDAESQILSDHQ